MAEQTQNPPIDVREVVRARYAAAARRSAAGEHEQARAAEASCCGDASPVTTDHAGKVVFGAELYDAEEAAGVPGAAVAASLGCGVPTAVADLHPGETVLDLARRNATEAGVDNVEFVQGYHEDIPLPEASIDVVISNCVINLAADKPAVLREAARVLRPGGRFAVSDVIADPDRDDAARGDAVQWTGCIAGALTAHEYQQALGDAGLVDVEVTETHRVHAHASAAPANPSASIHDGDPPLRRCACVRS